VLNKNKSSRLSTIVVLCIITLCFNQACAMKKKVKKTSSITIINGSTSFIESITLKEIKTQLFLSIFIAMQIQFDMEDFYFNTEKMTEKMMTEKSLFKTLFCHLDTIDFYIKYNYLLKSNSKRYITKILYEIAQTLNSLNPILVSPDTKKSDTKKTNCYTLTKEEGNLLMILYENYEKDESFTKLLLEKANYKILLNINKKMLINLLNLFGIFTNYPLPLPTTDPNYQEHWWYKVARREDLIFKHYMVHYKNINWKIFKFFFNTFKYHARKHTGSYIYEMFFKNIRFC